MLMYDLLKAGGCRIVSFSGTGLSTSAVNPTDHEGHLIAYPCNGLRLYNSHISNTLSYSFDNSNWLSVPPLGVMEDPHHFDILYVKGSASGTTYEGDVARNQ